MDLSQGQTTAWTIRWVMAVTGQKMFDIAGGVADFREGTPFCDYPSDGTHLLYRIIQ
jgi:hypothetical protein